MAITAVNLENSSSSSLLAQQRQQLPIFTYRNSLLHELEKNDTCIIVAETGSGKTTQLPQFVAEHGLERIIGSPASAKCAAEKLQIIVTQPRRIAAITVAERVAAETRSRIGEEKVGYCVRFDEQYSSETKIVYMTDGMLLRKLRDDPSLSHCGMLILDEVHERSVNTDILLGCVRRIQKIRNTADDDGKQTNGTTRRQSVLPPLKLVLMSATMDVDNLSAYFYNCRVLYLEGRLHPVEVHFMQQELPSVKPTTLAAKKIALGLDRTSFSIANNNRINSQVDPSPESAQEEDDYFANALFTIFQIHCTYPNDGDILVFLTGADEINALFHRCRTIARYLADNKPDAELIEFKRLYANLPKDEQLEVFLPRRTNFKKHKSNNMCNGSLSPPAGLPNGNRHHEDESNSSTFRSKTPRRCILATNIAETSVTIPNIKYVIDTGKTKVRQRVRDSAMERLRIVDISQASAMQRAGRAGRTQPGCCFRLYSQENYDTKRPLYTAPEILNCSLSSVVMEMMALQLRNISSFSFLDRPPDESFEQAFRELWWLGAIERVGKKSSAAKAAAAAAGLQRINGTATAANAGASTTDADSASAVLSSPPSAAGATTADEAGIFSASSSSSSSSSRNSVRAEEYLPSKNDNDDAVDSASSTSTITEKNKVTAAAVSCSSSNRLHHKWNLTKFGHLMAAFPVEPAFAACIVNSMTFRCTEEIITIIAMLSAEGAIFLPADNDADGQHQQNISGEFDCNGGDLTAYLKVWSQYKNQKPAGKRHAWCREKRINSFSMQSAARIRTQLRSLTWKAFFGSLSTSNKTKFPTKSDAEETNTNNFQLPHSQDLTMIRRCLCQSLFMHAATLTMAPAAAGGRQQGVYETPDRRYTTIRIHPSSLIAQQRRGGNRDERQAYPKCIVFVELVQSTQLYARNCLVVDEKWLEEDERFKSYYKEMREVAAASNGSKVVVDAFERSVVRDV